MSKTISQSTQQFLTTLAAPPRAPAVRADDHELIDACDRYCTTEIRYGILCSEDDVRMSSANRSLYEAQLEELVSAQHRLRNSIAAVPALTQAGMKAKARALDAWILKGPGGLPCQSDDNLAYSLARDLLRDA